MAETESTVKYTPAPGRILIRLVNNSNSLFKTITHVENSNIGEVIAVGDDYTTSFGATIKCPVKVGDMIQHMDTTSMGASGYRDTIIDNDPYRIVLFDAIMGVVS